MEVSGPSLPPPGILGRYPLGRLCVGPRAGVETSQWREILCPAG